MGQHGFARDMEHTLVRKEENSIWFCLKSNEETNAKYPFDFVLEIGYELKGNEVKVLWKVTNPSEKEMHFSIGAHPAFLCPFNGEKDKTGYSLCFDGLKEVHYHGITGDTGLSLKEELVLPLNEEKIALTPEFFDRCAYIVEGKQTGAVGLVTPEGRRYVNVSFDTPLFAVWSPEGKNAPFVCIEPWYGRCDAEDFAGTLEEREYNNRLEGKETFEASYTITFS